MVSIALHHALPGALPGLVEAVAVVDLLRAVDGDADQPVVLAEHAHQSSSMSMPLVCRALETAWPSRPCCCWSSHSFWKKGRPRGWARRPGKRRCCWGTSRTGTCPPCAPASRATCGARQGLIRVGVAVEVETVGAVEVADGRSGLDQQGSDARRRPVADDRDLEPSRHTVIVTERSLPTIMEDQIGIAAYNNGT